MVLSPPEGHLTVLKLMPVDQAIYRRKKIRISVGNKNTIYKLIKTDIFLIKIQSITAELPTWSTEYIYITEQWIHSVKPFFL